MNLPKQIKKYREQLGLSQEALAEKIYVSRQTISNWENERSYPDINNLLLLSVLFDVSLDELVKGDVAVMKKEVQVETMNRWTAVMVILMGLGLVIAAPSAVLLGWWALAVYLPFFIGSLAAAFKVEKLKRDQNIQTYQEILAFYEGQELSDEEKAASRKHLKRDRLIMMGISALIGLAICLVSFGVMKLLGFA